jgi:hypothetical protein
MMTNGLLFYLKSISFVFSAHLRRLIIPSEDQLEATFQSKVSMSMLRISKPTLKGCPQTVANALLRISMANDYILIRPPENVTRADASIFLCKLYYV